MSHQPGWTQSHDVISGTLCHKSVPVDALWSLRLTGWSPHVGCLHVFFTRNFIHVVRNMKSLSATVLTFCLFFFIPRFIAVFSSFMYYHVWCILCSQTANCFEILTRGQSNLAKAAPNDPTHTAHAAEFSHMIDRQTDWLTDTTVTIVCISCIRCSLVIDVTFVSC